MVKTEELILYGALAVGAYFLLKQFLPSAPKTASETRSILSSLGGDVWAGSYSGTEDKTYWKPTGDNNTYAFMPGEWNKLNTAQVILLSLDKVVPGSFLTRWALT